MPRLLTSRQEPGLAAEPKDRRSRERPAYSGQRRALATRNGRYLRKMPGDIANLPVMTNNGRIRPIIAIYLPTVTLAGLITPIYRQRLCLSIAQIIDPACSFAALTGPIYPRQTPANLQTPKSKLGRPLFAK